MNTITIDVQDWKELQRQSYMLDALQAMGVDNWSGYDEAMREYRTTIKGIDMDAFAKESNLAKCDEHKITLRIADDNSEYSNYSTIGVELDGKKIAEGSYGGEPEDNYRTRDYRWVQGAIASVAEALGAKVEVVMEELAEDE